MKCLSAFAFCKGLRGVDFLSYLSHYQYSCQMTTVNLT